MNVWDVIAVGIALSMDACALAIANCTVYKNTLNKKQLLSIPTAFAIFQGIMPLIGFFIGSLFAKYLDNFGGYLVAGVFYILSAKIIIDLIKDGKQEECKTCCKFSYGILFFQAVATSIDALVVGVSFSLGMAISVYLAVSIIAITTFILVLIACFLGKYLGKMLGKYAEIAGAIILFILATKELIFAII
ncbi:MAG: manganese efflux pump [Clostridia bacterium]|nr:manganese efflux pump [Clostridia bacterium]